MNLFKIVLMIVTMFATNVAAQDIQLSASPNPCTIQIDKTHCTTRVKWRGGNDDTKLWFVSPSTGESGIVGSGWLGDQELNWIDHRDLRLELRQESRILGSITVKGELPFKPYQYAGGSNLLVYELDWTGSEFNGRTNHGLVFNYHNQIARRDALVYLQKMYDDGQRSVRVVFPMVNRYANDGYTFDVRKKSESGRPYYISEQGKQNLNTLLIDLKGIGYKRFIVALFSFDNLSPYNWDSTNIPDINEQNDYGSVYNGVLREIRKVVIESLGNNTGTIPASEDQLHYYIDLGNEMAPGDPQKQYSIPYLRSIWQTYTNEFGSSDTVGFSIAADQIYSVDRLKNLYEIYCDSNGCKSLPSALDFHIYGDLTTNAVRNQESDIFNALHKVVNRFAPMASLPWIIGETYHNDKVVNDHFVNAVRSSGRHILFLTQWPLVRDRSTIYCPPQLDDKSCAAPTPYEFNNYLE